MTAYMIDFATAPELGTKLAYYRGTTLTLIASAPYRRRDGKPSVLLEWSAPDGRVGVSGLRAKSVRWGATVADTLRRSAEARAAEAAQGDK